MSKTGAGCIRLFTGKAYRKLCDLLNIAQFVAMPFGATRYQFRPFSAPASVRGKGFEADAASTCFDSKSTLYFQKRRG